MRILIIALFSILISSCGSSKPQHHRIVFQMSTSDVAEQKGLINNLENLLEQWQGNVEMEVVAHGPGLTMVVEQQTSVSKQIQSLASRGVVFVACENTMSKKNVTKEELVKGVATVPMGIGEIVKKQEQGWTYIKANF